MPYFMDHINSAPSECGWTKRRGRVTFFVQKFLEETTLALAFLDMEKAEYGYFIK